MAFTKNEVRGFILKHLKMSSKTDVEYIKRLLKEEGDRLEEELRNKTNMIVTHYGGSTYLNENDAMLVNEVIFDLIVERVITPGRGERTAGDFDGLPAVTVTNINKLDILLSEL